MIETIRTIAVGAAMALALATQAHAVNTRTWVSGTGVDQAGCGPIASPCRTLQYAHDNTSAGGEIDVKDSAGYGALTINKAISIVGDGSIAGVLATTGTNAITITAGSSDKVILRGLTIEGAGVAYNGIVFNSGAVLDIANCVVGNFFATGNGVTGNGIFLQPTSGTSAISIVNTTASNNGSVGVYYYPQSGSTASAQITIDHVTAINNFYGIGINNGLSSGSAKGAITNSLSSHSLFHGIYIWKATVSIDLSVVEHSGDQGIYADVSSIATIGSTTSISAFSTMAPPLPPTRTTDLKTTEAVRPPALSGPQR